MVCQNCQRFSGITAAKVIKSYPGALLVLIFFHSDGRRILGLSLIGHLSSSSSGIGGLLLNILVPHVSFYKTSRAFKPMSRSGSVRGAVIERGDPRHIN